FLKCSIIRPPRMSRPFASYLPSGRSWMAESEFTAVAPLDGGFSTAEIARALLTTDANVRKRIERARDRLRELDVDFDTPAAAQLCARRDAVLAVVYLLFSQGCYVTHGDMPIRRDLCAEARRLARMLAAQSVGDVPAVHALLALMCFHVLTQSIKQVS